MAKKNTNSKTRVSRSQKKIFSFSKRTWLILGLLVFGVIGVRQTFFSNATAFQYVGTHPNAAAQPESSTGRQIKSLASWNGKIYAGYGDWNKNTGPVNLKPFDPATNTFASTSEHIADTETIEIFKIIDNKLYALHVDPKSHWGAAFSLGDTSTGTLVWKNMAKPTMTHIFGITTGASPSELFMAGSLDNGSGAVEEAMVFRSLDGGVTWTESLRIPNRGGFNRMLFIGRLGDKVYAQNLSTADYSGNQPEKNAWAYNGRGWSKVNPINTYQPHNSGEFAGKIIAISSPYGGSLLGYDGQSTTVLRSNVRDYKIHSDGYLYVISYGATNLTAMRTKDLANWETIANVPQDSQSLAILNNTIYIGTSNSELYKAVIDPSIVDASPPSVALVYPVTPHTATTSNEFAVNAGDPASISKVEFYMGSTLIGTTSYKAQGSSTGCLSIGSSSSCSTSTSNYPGSYVIRWNGMGVAPGTYLMKAIAYDIYDNSSESASVQVTVPEGLYPPDTTSPTVTISSPLSTSRVRKNVSINAQATDDKGVVYMEAKLDGNTVATSVNGNLQKSVPLRRGNHSLIVTALDAAGNSSSKEVFFTSK